MSGEEELLGTGVLQKTQERNLSYIRTIEKEKREAFEVCKAPRHTHTGLLTNQRQSDTYFTSSEEEIPLKSFYGFIKLSVV